MKEQFFGPEDQRDTAEAADKFLRGGRLQAPDTLARHLDSLRFYQNINYNRPKKKKLIFKIASGLHFKKLRDKILLN